MRQLGTMRDEAHPEMKSDTRKLSNLTAKFMSLINREFRKEGILDLDMENQEFNME